MNNDNRKILPSLLHEHIFFFLFGLIALNCHWAYTERISLGILRPAFFHTFFLASILVGTFLLVGRISNLIGRVLPNSGKRSLYEISTPCLLVAGTIFLVPDFFRGDFPATVDHTTQQLRCQLTETAFWQRGTFLPWTSAIGAGVPLNDLFPPGGAMLYCLIRILSFFQLSPETAYRLTVLTSWFTLLGGLYAAGRLFFGIGAGTLAAGLMAVTAGSQLQGGWTQAFYVGMWPMTLCCGLAVITLSLFGYTIDRESRRWPMAALSITTAGTILAHPFGFALLPIAIPIFLVVHLASAENKTTALQQAGRNLVYILLGIGLAGWWLFPFIASSHWILPFGEFNQVPQQLAMNLMEGKFLENTPPILSGIILLGLLWGLISRQIIPTAFAVLGILFLLIDQATWKYWFFSPYIAAFSASVPLVRFSGLSKILGFLLIGGMSQSNLAHIGPIASSVRQTIYAGLEKPDSSSFFYGIVQVMGRSIASALIVSIFLSISVPALLYYFSTYLRPSAITLTGYPSQPPYARDFEAAIRFIQTIDPPSNDNTLLHSITSPKIGVHRNTIESCIPYRFGFGIVAPGYMPSMLLTTRSSSNDTTASILSGMKYFFAIGQFAKARIHKPGVQFLNRFGEITVFKLDRYRDTPIQILNAPEGRASIEANESNRLAIRLEGIPDKAWVRVGLSRYRKWRAYENGIELPISEHIESGEPLDSGRYVSVNAQNGILELRYAPETMDWLAYSLTGFCILGLVFCIFSDRLFRITSFETPRQTTCLDCIQTQQFRTIVYGIIGSLVVLAAIFFRFQQPNRNTQFWFSGLLYDAVSPRSLKPDNKPDFGFGLAIGSDHTGKILKAVSLREIYPEPLHSNNRWTTEEGPLWRLGLYPAGDDPTQGYEFPNPLRIQLNPSLLIDFFVANPHRDMYFPTGTTVELTLHFESGETASYRCPISQQGTH